MSDRREKQAGFTLIEVLVALFIFSILSASTLGVLTTTLKSKDAMERKSAQVQKISVTRMLLKSDLANTLPIAVTDEFGQPETVFFSGGDIGDGRLLVLSRTGWDNPGGLERRSGLQAVDYILKDKVLVRRVRARFNPVTATPVFEQALAVGVNKAELQFFDGENWHDDWVTALPPVGRRDLPKLASIELFYESGDSIRQVFFVGADQ